VLEETGMSFQKEVEMVRLATKMDLFSIVYVAKPEEAVQMADVGADAIIAHVGTTVGGSIGVTGATVSMDNAIERTQAIIDEVKKANNDTFFLAHGGPINTPDDVRYVLGHTNGLHGFVGASSLERMGVEQSLTDLTKEFKSITL
ncbi:MAG TPA: phosphoenolpyruvate hydrolase family protein, partial [Arenibacter sp.]|nr:phosphoenolpyruvate hydrolase family protein [Arenibacter sp.]